MHRLFFSVVKILFFMEALFFLYLQDTEEGNFHHFHKYSFKLSSEILQFVVSVWVCVCVVYGNWTRQVQTNCKTWLINLCKRMIPMWPIYQLHNFTDISHSKCHSFSILTFKILGSASWLMNLVHVVVCSSYLTLAWCALKQFPSPPCASQQILTFPKPTWQPFHRSFWITQCQGAAHISSQNLNRTEDMWVRQTEYTVAHRGPAGMYRYRNWTLRSQWQDISRHNQYCLSVLNWSKNRHRNDLTKVAVIKAVYPLSTALPPVWTWYSAAKNKNILWGMEDKRLDHFYSGNSVMVIILHNGCIHWIILQEFHRILAINWFWWHL